MDVTLANAPAFVRNHHPFDSLSPEAMTTLLGSLGVETYADGAIIYGFGQDVDALRIVARGEVDLLSPDGDVISQVHVGR
jgi:signal-transduction protein with cAMP-binding, CBS, and nucleotidyltransferase domain